MRISLCSRNVEGSLCSESVLFFLPRYKLLLGGEQGFFVCELGGVSEFDLVVWTRELCSTKLPDSKLLGRIIGTDISETSLGG